MTKREREREGWNEREREGGRVIREEAPKKFGNTQKVNGGRRRKIMARKSRGREKSRKK